MNTRHQAPAQAEQIRPIQFLEVGSCSQVPAPFIRITTCGLLTVEIVEEVVSTDPPLARYSSLTPEQLRGRGTTPALTLLKLLLNRYARLASKDWLLAQFCRDGELFSSARIENIVSLLRGLLCPATYQELRTHLVAHVRGSTSSGDGYQLAPYQLIWVDSEALTWNVEQAARMERFGDDGLPYWERAYELAKRGPYLPDEMYSEWASFRREEVQGMLRQSVQALARLYVARHGAAGEEEALLLLRHFWQEHPHEEDVLRALMERLGQRERYQEALQYYERFHKLLAEDSQEPTAQTQDVAAYLRTKQVQRPPLALDSSQAQITSPKDHVAPVTRRDTFSLNRKGTAHSVVHAQMIDKHDKHSLEKVFPKTLQLHATLEAVSQTPGYSTTIDQFSPFIKASDHIGGDTIQALQKLLNCGWELRNTGQLETAKQVMSAFFSQLQQFSSSRADISALMAEGLRLQSILLAHQYRIAEKLLACYQSVEYARQSENAQVLAAELVELGAAFEYADQPNNALAVYLQALPLAQETSSLIRSRLYGKLAVAFANNKQIPQARLYLDTAHQTFPSHPEDELDFLSSDHGLYKLARYQGLVSLAAGDPEKAVEAFESIHLYPVPICSKLEILNDLGKAAILAQNLEKYAQCLEEGLSGSILLKSEKRLEEVLRTFHQDMPKEWLREPAIKQVLEQMPGIA